MLITLEFSPEIGEVLKKEALRLGTTVDVLLEALVGTEVSRLKHIERSMPKERTQRPVGRPPMSIKAKQVKAYGETLRGIYLKRREALGEEFEKVLGEQVAKLEKAITEEDLNTLLWFMQTQPWTKKFTF